jgi:hypothetical protein
MTIGPMQYFLSGKAMNFFTSVKQPAAGRHPRSHSRKHIECVNHEPETLMRLDA